MFAIRNIIAQPNELVWSCGGFCSSSFVPSSSANAANTEALKLGGHTVAKKKKAAKKKAAKKPAKKKKAAKKKKK